MIKQMNQLTCVLDLCVRGLSLLSARLSFMLTKMEIEDLFSKEFRLLLPSCQSIT